MSIAILVDTPRIEPRNTLTARNVTKSEITRADVRLILQTNTRPKASYGDIGKLAVNREVQTIIMKILRATFALLFCFSVLSSVAPAQDKTKLQPLPDNATLAESQAWIAKNLAKNFGYATIDDSVKISDVKFDGCTMSYRVFQRYTDQKAALGDKPALGVTGATTARDIPYNVHEDVWVNLKEIDPTRISLGAIAQRKMQLIVLETVEKRDSIKFDRQGTSVRYNANGMRNTTAFPVKETAAESLAKGLMRAIRLCQAAPAS